MGMRGSRPLPAIFSHKLSMPCGQLFLFLHYRRINAPMTNVLMYLSRQSWRPLRNSLRSLRETRSMCQWLIHQCISADNHGARCVTLCARCVKPKDLAIQSTRQLIQGKTLKKWRPDRICTRRPKSKQATHFCIACSYNSGVSVNHWRVFLPTLCTLSLHRL